MTQTVAPPDQSQSPPRTSPAPTGLITRPRLTLLGLVILALLLRWTLRDIETGDYRAFLDPWYRHLQQADGLSGLADINSNYNTPYLVLLGLISKLPIPELIAIKSISVVFDLVLAFFAHKIIALVRPGARWLPTCAAGAALLLPTVVMNSRRLGTMRCDLCLAVPGQPLFLDQGRPGRPVRCSGWPSPSNCRRSSSCPHCSVC